MPGAPRAASAWPSKDDRAPATIAGVTTTLPDRTLSASYTRVQRILKTDEFSSVFRLRPRVKTRNFVLYIRDNGLPQARLGVVVAKRIAPRAVTRNLIKRMARELFRQSALPAVDCIIRLSAPLNSRKDPAYSTPLRKEIKAQLSAMLTSLVAADGSR